MLIGSLLQRKPAKSACTLLKPGNVIARRIGATPLLAVKKSVLGIADLLL